MNVQELTSTMLMMGCTINDKNPKDYSYFWNDIPVGLLTHINPHNELEYLPVNLVDVPKGVRHVFIPSSEEPKAALPLNKLNNRTLATVLQNVIRNAKKD